MLKQRMRICILIFALFLFGCTRVVVTLKNGGPDSASEGGSKNADSRLNGEAGTSDSNRNDFSLRDIALGDLSKFDLCEKDMGYRDVGKRDTAGSNRDGGVIPGTWVTISAGTFLMGSPAGEKCRQSDETQHQVTLTRSFEIQTTEITQGQFQTTMGYNPSYYTSCGSTCPVEEISWDEAAAYCNALSSQGGYAKCYDCSGSGSAVTCSLNASYTSGNIYNCPGYRLPTEAEWEYAYRAGTTTALHNNTNVVNCSSSDANANAVSWNYFNSSSTTHAVGGKPANNWGIYDMAGNVWEWCNDWYTGDYGTSSVIDPSGGAGSSRAIRGGSWFINPYSVRAAQHYGFSSGSNYGSIGARCVRTR